MEKLRIAVFLVGILCLINSCANVKKPNCQEEISNKTLAEILEKIIITDTFTVSPMLSLEWFQKKDNIGDTMSFHRFDTYLNSKLKKLSFYNDTIFYSILRKLYPNFSAEDSIYINCQVKSDTITKYLDCSLLSIKDLYLIDNNLFDTLSVSDRYRKYHSYYNFSRPFFFIGNNLCFVDVRFRCGVLCGDYWMYLMIRKNGNWIIQYKTQYGGS